MTDSLAIVLPALREAQNLAGLLPQVHSVASALSVPYEVIVVTAAHDRATWDAAARARARVVLQTAPGYGEALRAGFAAASAARVLTMDADLSHEPRVIADLWRERHTADVLIASRYVEGGSAEMPLVRRALSRILNRVFSRGLSLRVRDLSSGFRLYDRRLLQPEAYRARDFDILQEVLVRLYADGWRIREIPFRYRPRVAGSSHARVLAFGLSYARTFWTLWKLRNSIASADYDDRAFDSPIPLQKYWQRKRCSAVLTLVPDKARVLDVGCGSSRILAGLPRGSVALDILPNKLRYARRWPVRLVRGSGCRLPFPDASFACVICSQVIEHLPRDCPILLELQRVLAPGGRLILGTPDYGGWQWPLIEAIYARVAPGGYADEHITHYTLADLLEYSRQHGLALEGKRYILGAELIVAFHKAVAPGGETD